MSEDKKYCFNNECIFNHKEMQNNCGQFGERASEKCTSFEYLQEPPTSSRSSEAVGYKPDTYIVRVKGDNYFEKGILEFWPSKSGSIAVSVCKGFEVLAVKKGL